MGIFKKKQTNEEILAEGKALYEAGEVDKAYLKLGILALKIRAGEAYFGANYYLGRIELEDPEKKSDQKSALRKLKLAAKYQYPGAAEYLENYLKGQEAIEEYRKKEAVKAEEERRRAEEAVWAEEERRRAEEAAKAEEERKRAKKAARAEKERRRAEEKRRKEEEAARVEEERRREEEERRKAEEAARAEEERRKAEEAARAEEERLKEEEAARAEKERRKAEEAARAEEERRKEEEAAKAEEEQRKAEEVVKAEEEKAKDSIQNNKKNEANGFESTFSEDILKRMDALLHSIHGAEACEKKDYETAILHFNKAIELGLEKAKADLGKMYYYGWGVEKNPEEAFRLYMEAAETGYAYAQFWVGRMYEEDKRWLEYELEQRGPQREENERKALEWYVKAAEQGNLAAQVRAGTMYSEERGTSEESSCEDLAIRWFWEAGEQGLAAAQEMTEDLIEKRGLSFVATVRWVGYSCYERYRDKHGKKDFEDAFRWLQQGAVQGDFGNELAEFYEKEYNNKEEAAKWYYNSYEKGLDLLLEEVNRLKQEGIDIEKAVKSSKDEDEVRAKRRKAYEKGIDFYRKENYKEAFDQFWKAAMTGDYESQIFLSFMCNEGIGTEMSFRRAERWRKMAGRWRWNDEIREDEILDLLNEE